MWPSFGAFGWPVASTSVKFVTSIAKYRSWEMVGPGFGDTIAIVGVPAAGPWVATTLTDAETSGLRGVPLSWTSCSRIVWGSVERERDGGYTRVRRRENAVPAHISTRFWRGAATTEATGGCEATAGARWEQANSRAH